MNIRKVLLNAADLIERHESDYRFTSTNIPSGKCGSPGCALGWIAYAAGWKKADGSFLDEIAIKIGNKNDEDFYNRMEIATGIGKFPMWSVQQVADGLRIYADKYHPDYDGLQVTTWDSLDSIYRPPVLEPQEVDNE